MIGSQFLGSVSEFEVVNFNSIPNQNFFDLLIGIVDDANRN